MALTLGRMKFTVLLQAEGSPVQNEVGTVEVDVTTRAIVDDDGRFASDATAVADVDRRELASALREAADRLERDEL